MEIAGMVDNPRNPSMFERHPLAEERMRSAVILVKALLQTPGLITEHRREFVRLALWKITEAEGKTKYKTRFQSQGALRSQPGTKLQHEHVYPRAKMADVLLAAESKDVDEILKSAVGCTVTEEEHGRLGDIKHCDGWERYRDAGIVVIDTETGEPLYFAPSAAMQ